MIPTLSAPVGWATSSLGDLFTILDSRRVPINASERAKRVGVVPYYGATGQVGWIDDFLFDEELILLGEDGAPFLDPARDKAYLVRGRSWVNNHAHVLRALASTPAGFWKHQLNCVSFRPFVSGTTRLKLPQGPMAKISLMVPPLQEQRRIVEALDSYLTRLDDAVASLERAQTKLKAYRASVLKTAVEGRLVPTEADLARAEKRDYEPADVLLARVLKERRQRWEEANSRGRYEEPATPDVTKLRPLPDGWCWATVDQLGAVGGGLTKNARRQGTGRLPYLRVANVHANRLVLDEVKEIGVNSEEASRYRLHTGDLLVVEGNGSIDQIGRVAIWDGSIDYCLHQNHLIRVRFVPPRLSKWVLIWLLSPSGRVAIEHAATSTSGLHTLSTSKVGRLPVPLPPLAEQERAICEIEATFSNADFTTATLHRAGMSCSRLRQAILKRAFEGKLVDHDPADEPADKLLERIRAERRAATPTKNGGRRKKRAA